jgi:hypothetical protein
MPIQAIYFSRFKPTYERGGGSRRMMQIYELLAKIIPALQLVTPSGGTPGEKKLKKKIRKESSRRDSFAPPRRAISLRKWHESHLTMAYRLREFSKIWARSITGLKELDMAIMEDPIYLMPLFKKLLRQRIPVIASSQNLETLAPNQVKRKWALDFFKEELEVLSRCRLVITVSREEDVLLNNLGIPSLFIPYYPGEPILQRLLAVRHNREKTVKDGFLAIGNAKNLQTREGMKNLGRYWQENHLEAAAGKLLLGGLNSDEFLTPDQFGDSVEFLGALPHDRLDHILTRVKAFICYQESGSGSLTRICDMLCAGVPVLANTYAARSYYNMKGVIEFSGLDRLGKVLQQLDSFAGDIPLPPEPDIAFLETEIVKIMSQEQEKK